jgi:hypothetical protein
MSDQLQNMYRHVQANQSQLQATQSQLQATQSQLQATQSRLLATQNEVGNTRQELQQEREASELLHQQFVDQQECHCKLLEELKSAEGLEEDLRQSKMFADEVAKQAESLVNDLHAKLAGGEVAELPNGRSISGMILESARNALLIEAFSQNLEEGTHTPLSYLTEQNVLLQQSSKELSQQVKILSRQVEDGKSEVANLKKALELTAEDGQRKKRRGRPAGRKSKNV